VARQCRPVSLEASDLRLHSLPRYHAWLVSGTSRQLTGRAVGNIRSGQAKRRITKGEFAMSLEQAILEAVRALPVEKQQEILSHATRLRADGTDKKPFRSVKGLWADLDISLSAEEIEENQREMFDGRCRGGYARDRLVSVQRSAVVSRGGGRSGSGFWSRRCACRLVPLDRAVADALEFIDRNKGARLTWSSRGSDGTRASRAVDKSRWENPDFDRSNHLVV
jgi:hypothetical protein